MSKTLEDLGYEKRDRLNVKKEKIGVRFANTKSWEVIDFDNETKTFTKPFSVISMEELKAIYRYCIDNKWI